MAKIIILLFVILAMVYVNGENNGLYQRVTGFVAGSSGGRPFFFEFPNSNGLFIQESNSSPYGQHSVGSAISMQSANRVVDGKVEKVTNTQGVVYKDGQPVKQWQNSK